MARYIMIDNKPINNPTIGAEELGMLVYMLSKPNTWDFRPSELQARFQLGRNKTYRMLKKLIEAGHIVRARQRHGRRLHGCTA